MDYYTSPNGTSIVLNLSLYNSVLLNTFFFSFLGSFHLLGGNPNGDETHLKLCESGQLPFLPLEVH